MEWNKYTFGLIKDNKLRIWDEINLIDKGVVGQGGMDKISVDRKKSLLGVLDTILRGEKMH